MNPPQGVGALENDEADNRNQCSDFQGKLCECCDHFTQLFYLPFGFFQIHWHILLSFCCVYANSGKATIQVIYKA